MTYTKKGDNVNICAKCRTVFLHWTEYQDHVNLVVCDSVPLSPMGYQTFEEVLLSPSVAYRAMFWQPKRDARGLPVYEPMDPALKRIIVARTEKRLADYIIGG